MILEAWRLVGWKLMSLISTKVPNFFWWVNCHNDLFFYFFIFTFNDISQLFFWFFFISIGNGVCWAQKNFLFYFRLSILLNLFKKKFFFRVFFFCLTRQVVLAWCNFQKKMSLHFYFMFCFFVTVTMRSFFFYDITQRKRSNFFVLLISTQCVFFFQIFFLLASFAHFCF